MNLAGFCRNCLSRWFKEEAEMQVYGMSKTEWKEKYQK